MKTTFFAHSAALIGFFGAVLVVFAGGPAVAGHGYAMKQHPPRGDFPPAKANLNAPGSTKLRVEHVTVGPGADVDPAAMETALICEMMQGKLDVVIEGVPVTYNNGDVWTCPVEQVNGPHTNTGSTQAVMRVIYLLP